MVRDLERLRKKRERLRRRLEEVGTFIAVLSVPFDGRQGLFSLAPRLERALAIFFFRV